MQKKPKIGELSREERRDLISKVKKDESGFEYKDIFVETLTVCDELLGELESSKVSVSRLKRLLGFRREQLKELLGAY